MRDFNFGFVDRKLQSKHILENLFMYFFLFRHNNTLNGNLKDKWSRHDFSKKLIV